MLPELLRNAVDLTQARLEKLHGEPLKTMNLSADMLRLDLLHPVISGNKWYKLYFHLEKALATGQPGLLTCGGAYSNHIVATAAAGYFSGIPTAGIIRGEASTTLSPTLEQAREYGMQLSYTSRSIFRDPDALEQWGKTAFPTYYWIPEGGCSDLGIRGAATMLDQIDTASFTHICCAVGTGTMMAGLIHQAAAHQRVCGIPVLKIPDPENNSLEQLLNRQTSAVKWELCYGHHEGGYARYSKDLIAFMNQFYQQTGIPTDFVYTGKLMKAIYRLAETGYFPEQSRLLIIHSGGLQGNRGLPPGTLCY